MIDKIFDAFTKKFFNPNSEDDQEKLDELKVEVQGSQLPSELKKILTFKIQMFVDFMRLKKRKSSIRLSRFSDFPKDFPSILRLSSTKSEYGIQSVNSVIF